MLPTVADISDARDVPDRGGDSGSLPEDTDLCEENRGVIFVSGSDRISATSMKPKATVAA